MYHNYGKLIENSVGGGFLGITMYRALKLTFTRSKTGTHRNYQTLI